MYWTQKIVFILLFVWSGFCWSKLDSDYQFTRSTEISSRQLASTRSMTSLEVLVADELLNRSEQVFRAPFITDFQKQQFIGDARNALQLYVKLMNSISNKEEQSKIYFRMGYLYEMLSLYKDAKNAYQKVLALSQDFQRVKKTRQRLQKVSQSKDGTSSESEVQNYKIVSTRKAHDEKIKTIIQTDQNLLDAQGYVRSNQWEKALSSFVKASRHYAFKFPCYLEGCSQFSPSLRYFIKWIQEKPESSKWLHHFYQSYLSLFPRDILVGLSAAQYAFRNKDYQTSMKFYQRYILFEKKFIHQHVRDEEEKQERRKDLESIFYVQQKMAHLSKKSSLQLQAYDFYLMHSEERSFVPQVLYLKNVVLFQEGEYEKVAPLFRQITLAKDTEDHIREKAAFYAVRSLLAMNQVVTARKWVDQFSMFLPKKSFDHLFHSN